MKLANAAVLAVLAVLVALGGASCGGSSSSDNKANQAGQGTKVTGDLTKTAGITRGGTLKVGFSGPIVELDPQKSQSLQDQQQLENIYRGLTRPKSPADPEPVGDIAESWKVSPDKLTWTFKLRAGVKFHNGKPVTPADVVYSIERIKDPKTAATAKSDFDPVEKVEAAGGDSVRFRLSKPYGILPVALGLPAWSAILPKDSGDSIAKKPVGSGPFRYASQVRKTSLTLNRFVGYYDKKEPYVDKVVFTYLPDENARVNALRTGQVDFIDSVPLAQTAGLQRDKRVSVVKFDSSWVDEFGLNTKRKPFDDRRVRLAIAHALNRPEIAKLATFGLGRSIDTMVAPTSTVSVKSKLPGYDPKESRRLLKEAGVANKISLEFAPCGGDSFPQMRRAATVIARQLKAVGIDAKVQSLESAVWAEQVITKKDYDAFVCGLINGNDPDGHTFRYFRSDGAFNFSSYKGPQQLDTLLDQGREQSDDAQRAKTYADAWDLINRDVPWIPLYTVPGVVAAGKDVRGYEAFPEFNLRLETVGFAK